MIIGSYSGSLYLEDEELLLELDDGEGGSTYFAGRLSLITCLIVPMCSRKGCLSYGTGFNAGLAKSTNL